MEQKLQEYRARKRREQYLNEKKTELKSTFGSLFALRKRKAETMNDSATVTVDDTKEQLEELLPPEETTDPDESGLITGSKIDLIYYLLLFVLWATVYLIFIKLQFGTVFLVVSAFIVMYLNTRTGPKRPNEMSAYSVFNENCESIDGTLKAEQFEREIRYGAGAVH